MKVKKIKFNGAKLLFYLVVFLFIFIWILPTLGLFLTSLRTTTDIHSSGWWTIFIGNFRLTLNNYINILFKAGIGRAFLNSIIICIPSTIIPIIIASFAAYGLSYLRIKGEYFIFALIIAMQIIPIQITLIPILKMYKFTHLSGTFYGIWLAHSAYGLPFAIYLLRNFFVSLPYSLIESAKIDGANNSQILIKLILPLSLPAIISLAVFQFLWTWNDLLISLVYLGGSSSVAPLTVKIASLRGSLQSGWHIMASSAFLSMLFPMLIFIFLQKYFVNGILAGSIKE